MRSCAVFLLLLAIKAASRLLFRVRPEFVREVDDPWAGLRVVALLNHTSLFEPVLAAVAPNRLLWRIAAHGVVPVADKTLARPIVGRKRIREAVARFPRYEGALPRWYRLVKTATFENFASLRSTFPGVDKVGRFVVFNVAGNHLRIIAAVHFERRRVYIREILTHSEYDEAKWKR